MLVSTVPAAPDSTARAVVTCPGCGGDSATSFFDMPAVPVHCNVLWATPDAAKAAPRGAVRLAVCGRCALVFNSAFHASLTTYDAAYENSLHCSPRFQQYADELVARLGRRFDLRGKLVVEIGCGKGEFLRQLCRETGARGLGIDASYDESLWPSGDADGVTFVREPFSSLPADVRPALIFHRHVLEHIAEPYGFMDEIAAAARRTGSAVFVEVPNVLYTLRDLGIWDVIYEHCNYFSAPSLSRLLERAGLRLTDVYPAFGGQFLCAEATPADGRVRRADDDDAVTEVRALADIYARQYRAKVGQWTVRLRELTAAGRRVAVWGAGSKGVTFVNTVPGGESIDCVIDVNPRKRGRFVPVTGQPVVAPQDVETAPPDVVLIMNPLYRDEIQRQLAGLGANPIVDLV